MKKPNLVVILGAGASVAAGIPSTAELTSVGFAALPQIGRSSVQVTLPADTFMATGSMWRPRQGQFELGAVMQRALRGSYEEVSFELLLQALEALESFSASFGQPASPDNWRPVLTAFAEYTAQYDLLYDPSVLSLSRDLLVRALYSTVGNACTTTEHTAEAVSARQRHNQFLTRLSQHFRLIVLNLNYDDIVDSVLTWNDGFSRIADKHKYRSFDSIAWLDALKSGEPLMIHLHGSIRFGWRNVFDNSVNLNEPVKYDNFPSAVKSLDNRSGGERLVAGERYGPAPIISGLNKAGKLLFNSRPYGYYFLTAIQALLDAKRILSIGYSGRDYHINSWIEEHVRIHGTERRAAVVLPLHGKTPAERPNEFELLRLLGDGYANLIAALHHGPTGNILAHGPLAVVPDSVPEAYRHEEQIVSHLSSL